MDKTKYFINKKMKFKTIILTVAAAAMSVAAPAQGSGQKDFGRIAEGMSRALINHFWGASFQGYENRYYFNYGSDLSDLGTGNYWPEAHAIDVITDAYLRTGDRRYTDLYPLYWQGQPKHHHSNNPKDPWWAEFVDDMEWHVIAMIRMYEATGNLTYMNKARQMYDDWIWTVWGPDDKAPWYGGITWKTDVKITKNACSNGPAAIIAAKLYKDYNYAGFKGGKSRDEYLNEAKRIYNWEREKLFDKETGAIYDNMGGDGNINRATYTYNSGTFIGAAEWLYDITGDKKYIDDAKLAADFVINRLSRNGGVPSDAPNGDGGLFHGIFFRYFAQLINSSGLDSATRQRYVDYLVKCATVMANEGINKRTMLYGGRWHQAPADDADVCLTAHLTGCMLMEAVCAVGAGTNMADNRGLDKYNFFYAGESPRHRMYIVKDGKVSWSYDDPSGNGEISDAVLMSDGNILIAHQHGIKEVKQDGTVVWSMNAPKGYEIHSIQPIGKNKIVYVQCGNPLTCVVRSIPDLKVIREFKLPMTDGGSHGQMRNFRLSKQGTMLMASFQYGGILEFDSHGKQLRKYDLPSAWGVEQLANGNILGCSNNGLVREWNRAGKVVWEYNWSKNPNYKDISTQKAHRLKNGNTMLNNWFNMWSNRKIDPKNPDVQAIEVTPQGEVVWELSSWKAPANLGPATTIQLLSEPVDRTKLRFGDIK